MVTLASVGPLLAVFGLPHSGQRASPSVSLSTIASSDDIFSPFLPYWPKGHYQRRRYCPKGRGTVSAAAFAFGAFLNVTLTWPSGGMSMPLPASNLSTGSIWAAPQLVLYQPLGFTGRDRCQAAPSRTALSRWLHRRRPHFARQPGPCRHRGFVRRHYPDASLRDRKS